MSEENVDVTASVKPKVKKKAGSSRRERLEYAASLKRGKCIELLRPITQCTPAELGMANISTPVGQLEIEELTVGDLCSRLGISSGDLVYKCAGHAEGMRDVNDVKTVMVEKDIINGVIPARLMPMVLRIPTVVMGFKVG